MIANLEPRGGVWTVPAADTNDDPHTITLGLWMGDGPRPELQLQLSSGVGILTPDEARVLAATLLAAADHADQCEIRPGDGGAA
jgi:hypothetical protein